MLSNNEKKILDYIQSDLQIDDQLYNVMSEDLKISISEVLNILNSLKNKNLIRNISAIFSPHKLGYKSTLVAVKCNPENIDYCASVISRHPGVSHNYQRDNMYNIWYTLSVASSCLIDDEVQLMLSDIPVEDFIILGTEKMLKLSVKFSLSGDDISHRKNNLMEENKSFTIDQTGKEAIRLLLEDLPVCENPFTHLISREKSFLSYKSLVKIAEQLKRYRIMRRYSGILNQYNIGYNCNALTVWKYRYEDDGLLESTINNNENISHGYIRKVIPGKWEYPLFLMIHAKSKNQVHEIIDSISSKLSISDFMVLKTVKEFKKQRVKYFSEL